MEEDHEYMSQEALRKYRCKNGALGMIERLRGVSAEEIIIDSYFETNNAKAREILNKYERMIVLAKVDTDRYKKERDELHLDMAAYIHEHKLYREWFDYIYMIMTHMKENRILDAYKSEAMETWNYLSGYDIRNIYGLTTNNELLICDKVYDNWDIPLMKATILYEKNKISMEELQRKFIEEDQRNNVFIKERNENVIDVAIFNTMHFINERTKDIMPKVWLEMAIKNNVRLPRQWKDTSFYKEVLKNRRYMINRKGCKAYLKNAGNITEVFFMEDVTKDKKIIMIYRVSMEKGGFIGFFHLGDEYFFSPYRGSSEESMHNALENFILELYAEIVSGLDKDRKRLYALKEVEDIDHIEDYKSTHIYAEFGIYNSNADRRASKGSRYGTKQKAHNRNQAIRKLREGQHVSEEAKERAKEYDIELQEGYTFVRPYSVGGIKEIRKDLKL
jgi:hypothetical protein